MKKILLFVAPFAMAVSGFAQGTVNFNNFINNILRSPVYDLEPTGDKSIQKRGNAGAPSLPAGSQTYGGALLAGTGFTAQLWGNGYLAGSAVPAVGTFQLIATTVFRTGTGAGLIVGIPAAVVPNAPITGSPGNLAGDSYKGVFQVRAWNNVQSGAVATWATVMNSATVGHGSSGIFSAPGDLGATGTPPAAIPNLIGLESFNLTIVPEPSAIALGVLGLGTLMFLRRRK